MSPLTRVLAATAACLWGWCVAPSAQLLLSSRDRALLIPVEFVATTTDGGIVTDLAATDVTIRINGRLRTITSLEFAAADAESSADMPPVFADNRLPALPRSLVLIVDQDTIRPGRTVDIRDAIREILRGLSPRDRVAVLTVPFGGLAMDLTTDHGRVIQAITQLTSQGPRNESATDAQCRTLTTLSATTSLLQQLGQVEDPVSVVFFSAHQEGPANTIRMTGVAPVGGPCDLRLATFTELGHAVSRARAQFFVVQSDLDQRGRGLAGLEHITGVTGAPLLHLATDNGRAVVRRVLTQTRGHYVARVARDPGDAPGELRPVDISVHRPGVLVWRPLQLPIPRPSLPTAATLGQSPPALADVMRRATPARDLPLRMVGHVLRGDTPGSVRLAVVVDSPEPGAALTEAMIGVFDNTGQLSAGLEMRDLPHQQPALAALEVSPGVYRVRAAVRDNVGRTGSVEMNVDAALQRIGPLSASSVWLGLSRDGSFVPVVTYTNEPTSFVMFDLYGQDALKSTAVVEVADSLRGPARLTMPGRVESTADATRVVVTAVIPIGGLPPGDYVVRVTVSPPTGPAGQLVRTLRKGVGEPVK